MAGIAMGFGQVEAALAEVNDIASDRRTAFQARIRNFQRLGLLKDLKATRGNVPRYEPHHLLLLALAVELSQLGVTPDRAVRLLNENMTHVVIASRIASNWLARREQEIMYLYLDPMSLIQLMEASAEEESSETFFYGGWSVIRDLMNKGGTGDLRRIALINLTQVIDQICSVLQDSDGELLARIQDWSFEELSGEDEAVDELLSLSEPARQALKKLAP